MGRNFRNIKAWQHADNLAVSVYTQTRGFPREELYGLISQLRRAVVSVAANIAEGSSRGHLKDYLRFLGIAGGSLAEVEYLLELSRKIGYLSVRDYDRIEVIRQETGKTLSGLMSYIRAKAGGTN